MYGVWETLTDKVKDRLPSLIVPNPLFCKMSTSIQADNGLNFFEMLCEVIVCAHLKSLITEPKKAVPLLLNLKGRVSCMGLSTQMQSINS